MTYLLDTNVVSELRKAKANTNVLDWFSATRREELYMSVLTIGEIQQGINRLLRRNDTAQAEIFQVWLETLQKSYRSRLIPIDAEIASEWGSISHLRTIPVIDGLLAASAIVRGMTLVSRNTADLADTGVRMLNPFLSSR